MVVFFQKENKNTDNIYYGQINTTLAHEKGVEEIGKLKTFLFTCEVTSHIFYFYNIFL